jgi:hypothetical protein
VNAPDDLTRPPVSPADRGRARRGTETGRENFAVRRRLARVLVGMTAMLAACATQSASPVSAPTPPPVSPAPTLVVPTPIRPPQPWPPQLQLAAGRVVVPIEAAADVPGQQGACVELSGIKSAADIAAAACGTADATHKVVARVSDRRRCPTDVDVIFDSAKAPLQRTDGRGRVALCLDIDWAPGQCYAFDLIRTFGRRSPCVEPSGPPLGEQIVRAADRVEATTDASVCPSAAVVYSERKVVQCLEKPTS